MGGFSEGGGRHGIDANVIACSQRWLGEFRIAGPAQLGHWPQILFSHKTAVRLHHGQGISLLSPQAGFVCDPKEPVRAPQTATTPIRIYIAPHYFLRSIPSGSIQIHGLLRELLRYVDAAGVMMSLNKEDRAIVRLINYQVLKAAKRSFTVPVPKDERLYRIYQILAVENQLEKNLEELAKLVGASARTLERAMQRELGCNFTKWRQMIRTQHALILLQKGHSVTNVAFDVGYGSASAFIHAFKEHMGLSPKQYLKNQE